MNLPFATALIALLGSLLGSSTTLLVQWVASRGETDRHRETLDREALEAERLWRREQLERHRALWSGHLRRADAVLNCMRHIDGNLAESPAASLGAAQQERYLALWEDYAADAAAVEVVSSRALRERVTALRLALGELGGFVDQRITGAEVSEAKGVRLIQRAKEERQNCVDAVAEALGQAGSSFCTCPSAQPASTGEEHER